MAELKTKDNLLDKLRLYAETPDDDIVKYKNIIKKSLLNCPELLYSLNDTELEKELFDEDGNLLIDDKGNLIGEVDRYFGDTSLIRDALYIPDAQTKVKSYLCYEVGFDELPRYNDTYKYTEITFNIFVNGSDKTDKLTGISRHDLISSILREKFNWSSIFGFQTKLISNKPSITDNNYIVRTLIFQIFDTNGISYTPYNEDSYIRNNEYWQ